jgi:hypothetical protein
MTLFASSALGGPSAEADWATFCALRVIVCIAGDGESEARKGVETRSCKGWLNAYRKPVDPQAAPGVG